VRWLQQPGHQAVLIATALPGDDEMRERIARHQADRAQRAPALRTIQPLDGPLDLPSTL
jgi:adenosylcobinamide kinase / adenosylcobinamide-phosphate guanylyltransferase